MKKIEHKHALITGASSGIGLEISKYLAKKGMNIVITARREENLIELKKQIEDSYNVKVHIIAKDLSKKESPQEIYNFCKENMISIDFLVNNAGYGFVDEFEEYENSQLDDFLNVLLNSLVKLTHLFLKDMKQNKFGKILQVSSVAGLIPSGSGAIGIYGNIKNFINEFSVTLNTTYKKSNIHVCSLCPGYTKTGFNERAGFKINYSDVPSFLVMDSKEVAKQGVEATLSYKEVYTVKGGFNRTTVFLTKLFPKKFIRYVFTKIVNFGR